MRKSILTISIFLISLVLFSGCADYHIRQGNRLYNSLAYTSAIPEYQKGLSKKQNALAQSRLAECYYKINDFANAEQSYATIVQSGNATANEKLRYGQLLMRSGKYEQAKAQFDPYLASQPTDAAMRTMREGIDSVDHWKADSAKYTLELSKLNNGGSNFSPVWYKDGVVFASDRNGKKIYEWTGRPFLDLYYSKVESSGEVSAPVALAGEVNGLYHDGPAAFTSTGDTMYFTRDYYLKKKVHKSGDEVVNLKMCQAIRKDTSWSQISDFAFNDPGYSTGHPTLSSDGSTIYFCSDMPGGLGGTDIYMSKIENGSWGKPVNLGAGINTPLDEVFPSLWHDTVLFFSSYGHHNMGGLDVFKSVNTGAGWSEARNMGYPLNTNYDDFGIAMNDTGTAGFISSNRSNNTTQDAIYSFTVNDLRFTLEGIAVDKITQEPLEGVLAELTNVSTGKKETSTTGPDGKFFFKLNPNTDYTVMGSKDGFFTNTEPVSTKGKNRSENIFVKLKLELERIVVNKPIVLENIYYDLDKWAIRADAAAGLDKLVGIMKDNPDIKIELSSHTDSRAEDKYNLTLSQRRAESAVKYLIDHGIASERMIAKGYGETRLINRCSNGVKCTEAEHQANRRTEFKVLSIGKMNQ